MSGFWQRTLIDPELPTAIMPEGSSPSQLVTDLWTGPNGQQYQPVLISCVIDGARRHVGIVALIASGIPVSAGSRHPNVAQVTSSIASCLIDAGDARGIEA